MKKVVLLFFIILSFNSCSSLNWNTYTDQENGFSIQYPNDWTKEVRGNSVVFLSQLESSGDQFKENVNFMLQDLSQQQLTLDEYTQITKESVIANLGKQAIVSLKDATIQGIDEKEFVYNMNMNGNSLRIKQYWFIKNKKAYLFNYTAETSKYTEYETAADKVVESFEFL